MPVKLNPVPSDEKVLRWARELYANAVDRKDATGFAAAFTIDGSLRFGNAPAIVGRVAIEGAIAQFFTSFVTLQHEARNTFLVNNTLVLEATVTYARHDGAIVVLPAATIFHLAGATSEDASRPLADECRIYVDLAPLYAETPNPPDQ